MTPRKGTPGQRPLGHVQRAALRYVATLAAVLLAAGLRACPLDADRALGERLRRMVKGLRYREILSALDGLTGDGAR